MTTVKQGGTQKELTDIYVKHGSIAKEVQEGWVKQGGVVKQFFTAVPPAPPISPVSWNQIYIGGTPYAVNQQFTVTGAGPYTWSWQLGSATGGAAMALISGQGTATATFQATCAGAGELTGTVTCAGIASASVGLLFDGGV